ncbi:transposase [Nocardia sp. NPDC051990]|uniref:transposase n=1 Tax=Nocardia sp. NPDC051990 TaxID=3155285 RepID=UPI00342457C7
MRRLVAVESSIVETAAIRDVFPFRDIGIRYGGSCCPTDQETGDGADTEAEVMGNRTKTVVRQCIVGDGSAFPTAGHLAAYAGIAPITHRSGSSIRGEHPACSGNHKLERALFLSAFAALHDPASRTYYTRKREEGKKHNAALICLARRRCDVLYAMLETKQPYRDSPTIASTR